MAKTTDTQTKTDSAFTSRPVSDQPLVAIEKTVLSKDMARQFARIKANDDLKFAQEKLFFLAMVKRNKDLQEATLESLAEAFRQAASVGLSFNPQLAHVYLIPRKAQRGNPNSPIIAYASPGYRGLLHLAITGGAIKYGRAEVVYERDHFRFFGPTREPEFIAGGASTTNSLTAMRGARVGVFCHAKTLDGESFADMMDAAAVEAVRKRSEFPDSLMWKSFPEEGWKKAIIRRAQKTWPHTASAALLQRAVEILNDNEGVDTSEVPPVVRLLTDEHATALHAVLSDAGRDETSISRQLGRLAKTFGCVSIADLPDDKFDEALDKLKAGVAKAGA
jgi:recombinational DNA repair protein RecT